MNNIKTIIITGASRGIGRAIALRFATSGCHMIITCNKSHDLLDEVKEQILRTGSDCITFTGDLSVSDNVKQLFTLAKEKFGPVDILINNAGISHIGLLSDMSDNEWDHVIKNNLYSVFYCCRAAISDMVSSHSGRIINISSVWGNSGASCEVAYSASKGGVNSLTKALAKELAPSGIQVNAIACGLIDTDMNSNLSSEEFEAVCDEIPAGRAGNPSEVAETVYSICHQSKYITGQIITIDGGWM